MILSVPNIKAPSYKHSKDLSQKIAKQVNQIFDIQEIGKNLGIKDPNKTMIVLYHEFMWELLDYFENQGIIQKPIVFTNPEKAELKDVSDLIFIVKQTKV